MPGAEPAGVDVLMNRYNFERTGANLRETVLTVKNVESKQFGKLFEREVDGDIYAQPLVKTAVSIPGVGVRDMVFVATVNNSLYAFDANSPAASKPYWHVGAEVFGAPVPKSKVVDLPSDTEYLNFATRIGIVATPAIDPKTSTIYVVAQSCKGDDYRFQIHAFDLATGREKHELNSPRTVEASYQGNGIGSVDGKLVFSARRMLNRPGLLLIDGMLYLAFTAHLDGEPSHDSHGWIMVYSASDLKRVSVFCTTPDGIQGGIWQSGAGLAAEQRNGTFPLIYSVVANGSVGGRNYGQSMIQLYPGGMLSLKQAFQPPDQAYQNDKDLDLSTGPLLLPDLPLAVACGKDGKCYLVNRSTMKMTQEFQAGMNSYGGDRSPNIHGTPVPWLDSAHVLRLFVWAEEDFLRAFEFDGQLFHPAGNSSVRSPEKSMPGGMLTLSANRDTAGSAVVWASLPLSGDSNEKSVPGILRAFDASNLAHELWNSTQEAGRDRLGLFAKFNSPVVANGKVYVATFQDGTTPNKLVVYGLLSTTQSPTMSGQ